MNQSITHNTTNMKAIVMGALMFVVSFSFGTIANAEETAGTTVSNMDRAAMIEKLTQMRADLQTLRGENKSLAKEVASEERSEHKADRKQSFSEFKLEIADLPPEERRAEMIAYVTKLKESAAALRAEHKASKAARISDHKAERTDFKTSLKDLTPKERMEALYERLNSLLGVTSSNNEKLSNTESDSDEDSDHAADEEHEEEAEHSNDEGHEDEEEHVEEAEYEEETENSDSDEEHSDDEDHTEDTP